MEEQSSKDQSQTNPTTADVNSDAVAVEDPNMIRNSVVAATFPSLTAPASTTTTTVDSNTAESLPTWTVTSTTDTNAPAAPTATTNNVLSSLSSSSPNKTSFPPPMLHTNPNRNLPYLGMHPMPPLTGAVGGPPPPGSIPNLTGVAVPPPPLHHHRHHPMHPMHPSLTGDYNLHPAAAAAAAASGGIPPPPLPPMTSTSPWRTAPGAGAGGYPIAVDNSAFVSRSSKPYSKIITTTPPEKTLNLSDEQVTKLLSDSTLVSIQDRKFVPDYLLISVGQLELTNMTDEDRIGVYRDRELGQLGLRCRHCKGVPGNGRYFPETVRSLGQSTTSATIAKHMAEKCTAIPADLKSVVKQLKHEQDWLDQLVKKKMTDKYESRPKYGSRKIFFNNVWNKMTGGETK